MTWELIVPPWRGRARIHGETIPGVVIARSIESDRLAFVPRPDVDLTAPPGGLQVVRAPDFIADEGPSPPASRVVVRAALANASDQ